MKIIIKHGKCEEPLFYQSSICEDAFLLKLLSQNLLPEFKLKLPFLCLSNCFNFKPNILWWMKGRQYHTLSLCQWNIMKMEILNKI